MRFRTRGRRRRQRLSLARAFDRQVKAFYAELGEVVARLRGEERAA